MRAVKYPKRYAQVLDLDGQFFTAKCEDNGQTVTVNQRARNGKTRNRSITRGVRIKLYMMPGRWTYNFRFIGR
jgi:hypothetical protein